MKNVEVGDRVQIVGTDMPHSRALGTITNSPGCCFNGWTVRLDSGHYIGVDPKFLRRAL